MRSDAERGGTSAGKVVLVVFGCVVATIVLVLALGGALGKFAYETGHRNPYDNELVSVSNDCGEPVVISYFEPSSDSPTTRFNAIVAPGEVFNEGASVRLSRGLWSTPAAIDGADPALRGADCPIDAMPQDLARVRAPLLADADVVAAEVSPANSTDYAPPKTEVTTFVAKASRATAQQWDDEYAMAPEQGLHEDLVATLDAVAAGADWISSGAFDSAVAAEGLDATAYLDPATGVVVVRVWDEP